MTVCAKINGKKKKKNNVLYKTSSSHKLTKACTIQTYHHYTTNHQPINVPTAEAQAFLMDYLHIRRTGHNPPLQMQP
jgi:hypothetical protein